MGHSMPVFVKSTIFNNPLQDKYKALFIWVKGCRMGRSDKVSLWNVAFAALLINTRFCFFTLE